MDTLPSGGVARPCAQCADAHASTPLRASWGVVSDFPTSQDLEMLRLSPPRSHDRLESPINGNVCGVE